MTFLSANTPPIGEGCVLVYYVYDPHYKPVWGYDLAFHKDDKWYCWWDHEELSYKPIFWAIVDTPYMDAKEYWP